MPPAISSKKQFYLDSADKTGYLILLLVVFFSLFVIYHCYFFTAHYIGSQHRGPLALKYSVLLKRWPPPSEIPLKYAGFLSFNH